MEPVPDVNPPPIVYERYMVDVQEPTEGSLNSWTRWCQQKLKHISDKVQGLEAFRNELANWAQIKSNQIATLEPRVAALEKICEDVDFPKVATHFDNKYDTALARIRALELKMHALETEPMADRTRSRKEARR